MTRFHGVPTLRFLCSLLLVAAALLLSGEARAKYDPPPLPNGVKVVTTGGWLAPYDIRKYKEAIDIIHRQTGYEIEVLLVGSLEGTTIDEVASRTLETWKPGDVGKENGILIVVAPTAPKDERKARILAGVGVPISADKYRQILQNVIAPRVKSDDVRGGIAAGIVALGFALGSTGEVSDAGDPIISQTDGGGPGDAGAAAPAATAKGPPAEEGLGLFVLYVIGGFVAVVLGYVGFMRIRAAKSGG